MRAWAPGVLLLLSCAGARAPLVQVEAPAEKSRYCANVAGEGTQYNLPEWRVTLDGGEARVDLLRKSPNQRDPLPIPLCEGNADRYVLKVEDGFLVGCDIGEFGGGLAFVGAGTNSVTYLSKQNVHGLFRFAGGEVLALQGINHLGLRDGVARWFVRDQSGRWAASTEEQLSSGPTVAVARGAEIYALTLDSLVRIDGQRRVSIVAPIDTTLLYPNSMVVDGAGTLWVGMRYFVLRIQPERGRYGVTWLAPVGDAPNAPTGQCGERRLKT